MTVAGLEALDGLVLRVRRGRGDRMGDRRFPGRPGAAGIEIEAHAPYAPGDDLRHLDWNAFGRLDALLVRRFTAEREVAIHLLLDCSASMAVPARDRKLAVAAELVLALAYVALAGNDAVRIALLPGGSPARISPLFRQRASALRVAALLDTAAATGRLALGNALEDHVRRHPRAGVAVVVSDLMVDPADVARGLEALRSRGWEIVLLHVIGPAELDPARRFSRALLRDAETGVTRPVALTPAAAERYRDALARHLRAVADVAARTEAAYARLTTDVDVRRFVRVELPALGIVGRR
jgi:uncharacterized protein (DUF58 family)